MAATLSFDDLNPMAVDGTLNPFAGTDSAVAAYARRVIRRFARARSALSQASDLYAMMEIVYGRWDDSWPLYRGCLETAYGRAYALFLPHVAQPPATDAIGAYVASYALPEGFVPQNEWERRRARSFESVVAAQRAHGTGAAASAMVASRNSAVRMMRQGADDATVLGMADAMADAGVTRVRYNAVEDSRTCGVCLPRDGRTYPVDRAPRLPEHPNCRCWYSPVN
jgi:SPP1 gp7 family putative phage head morphogenesis protein